MTEENKNNNTPADSSTGQAPLSSSAETKDEYIQKAIETYFSEHDVQDPDLKVKILPEITQLIYDRNMAVVSLDKETDEYKQNQYKNEIRELEEQIHSIIKEMKE